jgi:plasmid stability protein
MATLYVENLPKDLYEALRRQARERHRSIAAEVLALLEESVPTQKELKARQKLLRKLSGISSKKPRSSRVYPSTEEMQREDRGR